MLKEIENRRSIRRYTDEDVSYEDLMSVLEAGRLAPSGCNYQPWKFIVVRDKLVRKKISEADHAQDWMLTAPVLIAVLADVGARDIAHAPDFVASEDSSDMSLKKAIRDSAIAVGYMLLEAQSLGLGTCWTGWYEQEAMRKALGIPPMYFVIGIICLGHSAEAPAPRPRRSMDELLLAQI